MCAAKTWSAYQTAIFDFVGNDTRNGMVEAVAGSGKSTTIKEAYKRVKGDAIFLAFNKAIADELKAAGVNGRTFHSLCMMPVMRSRGARDPDTNKLRKLCDQNMTGEDQRLYATFAQKLVGLARQVGIGCLVKDTELAWIEICDHHNIEPDSEEADFGRAIELARELLSWSNASNMVDFDDMLYFAVKDGISLTKFDFVFVDEAQDTNAIQRAILRKIMKPTSRIVAVGDPAQAIYGFRGADSASMSVMAEEFGMVRLPLTISYRCPVNVVKYAQQWVSHIEAAPNAVDGIVEELGTNFEVKNFTASDLVVCRKSAPLITLAFRCIRANVPVQVMGREIGQGLKALIKKMNAKGIDRLQEKLEAYMEREVEKARSKKDDAKAEAIEDKVGSLLFLIAGLREDKRTVPDLEAGIDYLFKDKSVAVKFATIHKSKGLEAPRVFWLGRAECPARWAKQDWQKQQEINLCYVAATRAQQELYTIELKDE